MAEMEAKGGGGHKPGPGVKKGKKLSTRVDLTPMVDLGFLLITFFIFTTTMAEPTAMKLAMPKDTKDEKQLTEIEKSGALTIMLGKADYVYYYFGDQVEKLQVTNFQKIRDVIIEKKKNTPSDKLFITIKPDKDATYGNAERILDEMLINDIPRYAMVDPSEQEYKFIQLTEQANGVK